MEDRLSTEQDDPNSATRIAIALDELGQEWELLIQHYFVEEFGMCSQIMLMSNSVHVTIVTNLVLYRDVAQVGDREEVTYTILSCGEPNGERKGSQLLKISRFYSLMLKEVLYDFEIGEPGVAVNIIAPGEICAALWRMLDNLCGDCPPLYDQ
jgi:hypothetical protein